MKSILRRAIATSTFAVLLTSGAVFLAPEAEASALAGCAEGHRSKTCIYVDGIDKKGKAARKYAYRDSFVNDLNEAMEGRCEATESKTFTWGASLEITGELQALMFSKVAIKVGGHLENSTTTGFVSSATFRVPAHRVVYCDRGAEVNQWHGRKVTTYYPSSETGGKKIKVTKKYKAKAPERAVWWISSPKKIK